MTQSLHCTTLLVVDYDEAIDFFCRALRFALIEDRPMGESKRWVRVAPVGGNGASLLLAKATTPEQQSCVGNQAGGRVFLFLHSSDFAADHRHMLAQGVRFAEQAREEDYGTVAVFLDLYGNQWDLLQPRAA